MMDAPFPQVDVGPTLFFSIVEFYHVGKKSTTIPGYIDPIIQDVLDTGIGILSLDAPSSLEKAVETAAGKVVIMGNVPTALFADGAKAEMESAVDACIRTAAAKGGYILASGCEIPMNSTEDRIRRFFDYSHRAGREFIEGSGGPRGRGAE